MSAVRPTHHVPAWLLLRHCAAATSRQHLLHIRAVLDILPEIADVATDLPIGLEAEGDDGDEAECEPFPALHRAGAEVAAILALHGEVFGAGELRLERWEER